MTRKRKSSVSNSRGAVRRKSKRGGPAEENDQNACCELDTAEGNRGEEPSSEAKSKKETVKDRMFVCCSNDILLNMHFIFIITVYACTQIDSSVVMSYLF